MSPVRKYYQPEITKRTKLIDEYSRKYVETGNVIYLFKYNDEVAEIKDLKDQIKIAEERNYE